MDARGRRAAIDAGQRPIRRALPGAGAPATLAMAAQQPPWAGWHGVRRLAAEFRCDLRGCLSHAARARTGSVLHPAPVAGARRQLVPDHNRPPHNRNRDLTKQADQGKLHFTVRARGPQRPRRRTVQSGAAQSGRSA